MDSETLKMVAENIPVQRLGERVDIADICLFVVTRGADLLTGTTIVGDGGAMLTDDNSRMRMSLVKAML
ncbi:hypothetical protein ACOMHN_057541 [Nucella lapillus]